MDPTLFLLEETLALSSLEQSKKIDKGWKYHESEFFVWSEKLTDPIQALKR